MRFAPAVFAIAIATSVLAMQKPRMSVDVRVFGADESAVTNLTREDFSIYEDGQRRDILGFEPVETPYRILLLVDVSSSMESDWTFLEPAIGRFISKLRPQDQFAIAAFAVKPELLLDWTNAIEGSSVKVDLRPFRVQQSVAGSGIAVKPHKIGESPEPIPESDYSYSFVEIPKDFYGALSWAGKQMEGVRTRRGVIVFTDGAQPGTKRERTKSGYFGIVNSADDKEFQKILKATVQSETPFYFLTLGVDVNPRHGFPFYGLLDSIQTRSRVQQLGEATKGGAVFPKKPEDVAPLYEQIARELGITYTLTFDGIGSNVEVRVRGNNLHVRQSSAKTTGE